MELQLSIAGLKIKLISISWKDKVQAASITFENYQVNVSNIATFSQSYAVSRNISLFYSAILFSNIALFYTTNNKSSINRIANFTRYNHMF